MSLTLWTTFSSLTAHTSSIMRLVETKEQQLDYGNI